MTELINYIRRNLHWVIFALLFGVLATQAAQLKLLLDDNVHIYPALLQVYGDHFKGYTYDYGLFRPLGLAVFYWIYSLYLQIPWFAHLFMLLIHTLGGVLLFHILKKYLGRGESLALGLLYVAFPFFAEQYGWFAASNATFANLVLLAQAHVALNGQPWGKKILFLAVLQTVGVLLYESVLITFIPLIYLVARLYRISVFSSRALILWSLALPSAAYVFLRSFVIKPHVTSTIREIGLGKLVTPEGIDTVLKNIAKLFNNLFFLFFREGPSILYWKRNFVEGVRLVFSNPVALLTLNYLALGIVAYFLIKKSSARRVEKTYLSNSQLALFFLMLSVFTVLPNILLLQPTFPFRTLALPVFFLLLAVLIWMRNVSRPLMVGMSLVLFTFFTVSTLFILSSMHLQSEDDEKFFTHIGTIVDQKIQTGKQTTVIVNNFPNTTRTNMIYGEFLGSCVSTDWCLQAALNRRTNKVAKSFINPAKPPAIQPSLIFDYDRSANDLKYRQ